MRKKIVYLLIMLFLLAYVMLLGHGVHLYLSAESEVHKSTIIVAPDIGQPVQCQFDQPIKHITLIMHWYDNYTDLNFDYQTLVQPENPDIEVWGWANCMWQPSDNWAACDIYTVLPEYVHADLGMDTLGHEVLHGACGDFHE